MGQNPYIDQDVPPPKKSYKLTLKNTGQCFDVDPNNLPDHDGLQGSILGILLENGIEVDHSCGGVLACSTCHIWLKLDHLQRSVAVQDSKVTLHCFCFQF